MPNSLCYQFIERRCRGRSETIWLEWITNLPRCYVSPQARLIHAKLRQSFPYAGTGGRLCGSGDSPVDGRVQVGTVPVRVERTPRSDVAICALCLPTFF